MASFFRKPSGRPVDATAFRVLTVLQSAKRQENVLQAARTFDDFKPSALGRMLLFATEDALSLAWPERMFDHIWAAPTTPELRSILASPAAVQNQDERRKGEMQNPGQIIQGGANGP